ncbi:MAG: DUF547 domain-containing protein [Alphaproteobacteria bacterium]|nr:DUF547 domain-containing protein [Alphaproteobacteria bacterium]
MAISSTLKTMGWIAPLDEWRTLIRLFGPPRIAMAEMYGDDTTGARFDHGALDTLLRTHVRANGRVDYAVMADRVDQLDHYIGSIADVDFAALSRDEKLALLINAYNAFTLRLIAEYRPLRSIRNIPNRERWSVRRWRIGDTVLSLYDIENTWLRARFVEPRIHFAINCASIGCPPLRAGAYTGATIDGDLAAHTQAVHDDARWAQVDGDTLWLSKVYLWYAGDFVQAAGGMIEFASRYLPTVADSLAAGTPLRLRWLPYDWSLNALS